MLNFIILGFFVTSWTLNIPSPMRGIQSKDKKYCIQSSNPSAAISSDEETSQRIRFFCRRTLKRNLTKGWFVFMFLDAAVELTSMLHWPNLPPLYEGEVVESVGLRWPRSELVVGHLSSKWGDERGEERDPCQVLQKVSNWCGSPNNKTVIALLSVLLAAVPRLLWWIQNKWVIDK